MARYLISTIIEPDRNPGVGMRLSAWRDAVQLFRSRPITGTGLGTYDEVTYRLEATTADPFFRQQGWHAHNVFCICWPRPEFSDCWPGVFLGTRSSPGWCGPGNARTRDRLTVAGALWSVLAFLVLSISEVLIGARVHASLRMNLTIGLVVWGLYLAAHAARSAPSLPSAHGTAG